MWLLKMFLFLSYLYIFSLACFFFFVQLDSIFKNDSRTGNIFSISRFGAIKHYVFLNQMDVWANMSLYIKNISLESKVCESSCFRFQSSSGILIFLVSLVIFRVFLYKEVCPNSRCVSHFTTFITLLDIFPSHVVFLHIANPEPHQAKNIAFIFISSSWELVFVDRKLFRSNIITFMNTQFSCI